MTYSTSSPAFNANLVGTIGNPSASNIGGDGLNTAIYADHHGALLMREVGGRYASQAMRSSAGNVFMAHTAVAGVTVPATATTLASTAGMINPTGSGIVVEMIAVAVQSTTIQVAVKNMAMGFHRYKLIGEAAPTSVTALAEFQMPIGKSGTATAHAHTAATFTNAGVLTPFFWLFPSLMTAVGTQPAVHYFNGEITFGEGVAMALVNSTSALAGQQISYIWAEWPA